MMYPTMPRLSCPLTYLLVSCSLLGAVLCDPMTRVLFDEETVQAYGSKCLDGSPAGFYIKENVTSQQWVFYLEGGGLCIEAIDCIGRTKGSLGSSKYWGLNYTDTSNVLTDDPSNPFRTFNRVYLPYCSGDTWLGIRRTKSDWLGGLYTAGHLILQATLDHLVNRTTLGKAKDALLTGGSAGGIGALQNADYFSEYFSKKNLTVRVKVSPQAGFYFPRGVFNFEMYAVGLRDPFDIFASDYIHIIDDSQLDESCVAAVGPVHRNRCWDANVVAKYIDTPLFLAENRFDENQIHSVLLCPPGLCKPGGTGVGRGFMIDYGTKMVASLKNFSKNAKPGDGLFMPSCLSHTSDLCMTTDLSIDNITYRDALADWFLDRNKLPHVLFDPCVTDGGMPCQLNCGGC